MTARSNVVRSVDHQPNLEKVPFEQIGMAPVVAGSRYRVNPGYSSHAYASRYGSAADSR